MAVDNYTRLYDSLGEEDRIRFDRLLSSYHFSHNEKQELLHTLIDFSIWGEESIFSLIEYDKIDRISTGQRGKAIIRGLRKKRAEYVKLPDYKNFNPKPKTTQKRIRQKKAPTTLIGRCPCPVDGEKTRCCKLTTLDAILGCPFGCSYCSIASFYENGEITVPTDLDKRLDSLTLDKSIWHIGTGQSSDSLAFSDDYKTMKAMKAFAEKHPEIIIELKTKSARTDFLNLDLSRNFLFTWSLNAPTIIEKEEHYTASLDDRIKAAKIISDHGYMVGFHLHPIIYFKGFEKEYENVVSKIVSAIPADRLCTIGMGTLTFTKANLNRMRLEKNKSKVTQIPLTLTAGKYSYPLETKEYFFSKIYSFFPPEYKKEVFFYLCMEDPSLWMKVFNREYSSDKEFETDMKTAYFKKLNSLL